MRGKQGHRVPPRRRRHQRDVALLVASVAVWSLATGCSSPSYNDLSKIAHGVPVPKGLTVDHEDTFTNGGIGGTKQVNLVYSNPAGDCDALRTAWAAALKAAHRHYSIVGTAQLRFTLPNSSASVAITLDWAGPINTCEQPAINVEQK